MPSPFPGMDPFLEINPIFHELHTLVLSEVLAQLQPQLEPTYVARLERHLSEGSVWDAPGGLVSLHGKEPDVTIAALAGKATSAESTAVLTAPSARAVEELGEDELQLRRQRRIVIYVNIRSRVAVASIELLSPSNKEAGSTSQSRYMEKRASALNGGLHWIEIDLLRGGRRLPLPSTLVLPARFDYLTYVAQTTPTGWNHLAYTWGLRDALPPFPIPLLGTDQARLDLGPCFREAYDRAAAGTEAAYDDDPPPAPLSPEDAAWADALLRAAGLRR